MTLAIILTFAAALLLTRCSALSADSLVDIMTGQTHVNYPVAAAKTIYRHALVGKDPAGYIKPFEPGDVFVGLAFAKCDNSAGAAGALYCDVITVGDFIFALTSAAVKDAGKPVFATADNAIALTGHPDAFVGYVMRYHASGYVLVRLRRPGEKPPNGVGSIELFLSGHETFTVTGATAGTSYIGGFEAKSILGTGWVQNDAEDAGLKADFDAVAEVALASLRQTNDNLPVDKGVTLDVDFVAADSGDANALDIDIGLGTALTTNSEADIDHADMAQLAAFHIDGASDNILCQSDDATTDVAAVDSTKDNDSTTDVAKHLKIVVRPAGTVEFWISGARVLSTTTFALLSTALVAAFVNMEKTSNDTTASIIVRNLRVAGGITAQA